MNSLSCYRINYSRFSTFSLRSYIPSIGTSICSFSKTLHHSSVTNISNSGQPVQNDNLIEKNKFEILNTDEYKTIETRYPQPGVVLNNIMSQVCNEFKKPDLKPLISYRHVGMKQAKEWRCTCVVKWPSVATFSSVGKTKQEASRKISLGVLHWLTAAGKLKDDKPVFYDYLTVQSVKHSKINLSLGEDVSQEIDNLLLAYNTEVKEIIEKSDQNINEMEEEEEIETPKTSEYNLQSRLNRRNKNLERRLASRKEEHRENNLPIFQNKDEILKKIEENSVVIIRGEPGCGKSTQVVQMILDDWTIKGEGANCNIMVTQPRRISAVSLAEQVARERMEQVGDVVGYNVRFKSKIPRDPGGIIFCSTGIALRQLQSNPSLPGVTHFIIDEAHERDVNTDLLMMLLKRAVSTVAPSLKLIIMSATLNSQLISNYYSNAVVVNVPGRTYPVSSYYLDDLKTGFLKYTQRNDNSVIPRVDSEEVSSVIEWLNTKKPPGGILVFLPGWGEIKSIMKNLTGRLNPQTSVVLPLHSRLPIDQQNKVFAKLPPGIRKIVLATNVAETSITVEDIVYVVDTGVHKEERLVHNTGVSSLGNQWISKANANQRQGRAGRVRPGECYRLYSKSKYQNMDEFPVPEMQRVPLDKIVLDLKTFTEVLKAETILSFMVEPPSSVAIRKAVADLTVLGALDEEERLTYLGHRISKLTTSPRLSKALVMAAVFRCLPPILKITSILSSNADMFSGSLEDRELCMKTKKKFHQTSDHLAMLKLYEEWVKLKEQEGPEAAREFCLNNMLREETLRLVERLCQLSLDQLVEAGVVEEAISSNDGSMSYCEDLLLGILLTGVSSFLTRRTWDYHGGRFKMNSPVLITESGVKATTSSDSVNHKQKNLPSPFLVYCHGKRSEERRTTVVRDTSVLSPASLALFNAAWDEVKMSRAQDAIVVPIKGNTQYRIVMSASDAAKMQDLFFIMDNVVTSLIKNGCKSSGNLVEYAAVSDFRDKIVDVLQNILPKVKFQII